MENYTFITKTYCGQDWNLNSTESSLFLSVSGNTDTFQLPGAISSYSIGVQSYLLSYPFQQDGIGYIGWGLYDDPIGNGPDNAVIGGTILTIKPYMTLATMDLTTGLIASQNSSLTISIIVQYSN